MCLSWFWQGAACQVSGWNRQATGRDGSGRTWRASCGLWRSSGAMNTRHAERGEPKESFCGKSVRLHRTNSRIAPAEEDETFCHWLQKEPLWEAVQGKVRLEKKNNDKNTLSFGCIFIANKGIKCTGYMYNWGSHLTQFLSFVFPSAPFTRQHLLPFMGTLPVLSCDAFGCINGRVWMGRV